MDNISVIARLASAMSSGLVCNLSISSLFLHRGATETKGTDNDLVLVLSCRIVEISGNWHGGWQLSEDRIVNFRFCRRVFRIEMFLACFVRKIFRSIIEIAGELGDNEICSFKPF